MLFIFLFYFVLCGIRDPNYKPFGLEVLHDERGELIFIVQKKGKIMLTRMGVFDMDAENHTQEMWTVYSNSLEWKTRFKYGEKEISATSSEGNHARKLIKGHKYYFYAIGNLVRGEEEEIEFVY
ncbi:hypothetical protein LEP1GSC050_1922 [Leptospira broomii serovar Hurstbridge str. 5399]|uniref:Uncharacterized protein n=1 Tax=Leptospira broomii serovar Hurstbridge str. 5399 TaxID=1049789 RepID=T0GJN1_9LEPT|nr:hypothetical protein LEP1GSC050_1922 [Leptospira broomii serovar Hurstbridge str. 5399]